MVRASVRRSTVRARVSGDFNCYLAATVSLVATGDLDGAIPSEVYGRRRAGQQSAGQTSWFGG